MKEQRISRDTAILAKEKGFNWKCDYMYDEDIHFKRVKMGMHGNPNGYLDFYSAPTQTMLARWLRELYEIEVDITPGWSKGRRIYEVCNWKGSKDTDYIELDDIDYYELGSAYVGYNYESSFEKGLVKALELIEQ